MFAHLLAHIIAFAAKVVARLKTGDAGGEYEEETRGRIRVGDMNAGWRAAHVDDFGLLIGDELFKRGVDLEVGIGGQWQAGNRGIHYRYD